MITPQERYEKILELGKVRDLLFWEEGKLLHELKTSGDFKKVFGNDGEWTWNSFVKQSELPMSTVEMKIRMYVFWRLENNIPVETLSRIHTRKLDRAITPIKLKKTTIVDVIDVAPKISFLDFKKWIEEILKS